MYSFQYVKVKSLAEAQSLLAANPEAKVLAGGMTLVPTLKNRLAQPTHLIDIGAVAEIGGIGLLKNGVLAVGAMTRHAEVASSQMVKDTIPALAHLASQIADPQVRNLGTIGGSVANNDPAADYPAAVLALGATIVTTKREIAADDFFQGMFTTALEPGEIITSVQFPVPKKATYQKFPHPASGYAMTGVFIADTAKGVRVAVTGAAPCVFRWTAAESALAKNFTVAAVEKLAVDAEDLNEDFHAPKEYRANLVQVMTRRAVAALV